MTVSRRAGMPAENPATIGPSSPSTRTSRYSISAGSVWEVMDHT